MKIAALLVGLLVSPQAYGFAPSQKSSSLLSRPTNNNVVFSQGNIPAPITTSGNTPCIFSSGHSISSSSRLFMGWGPEPIWSTCTVTSNIQACPSGSCVSLKIDVPDGNDFLYPGQYVQVLPSDAAADTKPLFLAIASAPTGTPPKPVRPSAKKTSEADSAAGPDETSSPTPATWEFLVKKTDNNGWLTSLPAQATVSVSQPMGSGFPIADNIEGFKYDFPTQNILLFATGSGIAPIRSAIESRQLNVARPDSGGRTCTLYYGVRTPDDMSYVSKFAEWEEMGVQVVPVVSQPDVPCESGAKWGGRTGYVQNALEEDGVPIPRNSGALLCGVKGMTESVKSMLMEAGVFEGRCLTNF
mmetsp:Transcript_12699/g.27011  ORF Transcript_12699/g.27011 Transcript_12699/m.27011 type:complete len:357 (-) Transcript_12699:198-1268(-)|eukprot:CAMPEP_0171343936 /NCGR_PEP_ID=MMETSP0878-20121228/18291_1 /TAXON_ID=67004 /ORGANISM="Thalassiosira weissflogii, Strain CCMP1336" /LENGTH=356 /DNA_ID=CAMNT_0011846993 /DNA_START=44 /DNA_END=1114 /DNA_ORIENTATION=+